MVPKQIKGKSVKERHEAKPIKDNDTPVYMTKEKSEQLRG